MENREITNRDLLQQFISFLIPKYHIMSIKTLKKISLSHLKLSAYLFDYVTGYDNSYETKIKTKIIFSRTTDLGHVMKILNDWGGRHLVKSTTIPQ